jgi:glycosyltransferase involved in cell wall biosynthesis
MRIAYFTNQYPAPSHTFIRREIAALEGRGHDLYRYAIRDSSTPLVDPDDILEARKTCHILRLGIARSSFHILRTVLKNPYGVVKAIMHAKTYAEAAGRTYLLHLAYLLEAAILADWCRRDKIGHLHAHFGTNPTTIAALAHQMIGIRFSFTAHGADEFDRPIGLGLGHKIEAASFTVAVSSFGRSQLMRWARPEDWRKIHTIHCGIDNRYLADQTAPLSTEKRLLCVARLSVEKGHLVLLEAAKILCSEGLGFKLVLAGDGPLRQRLEREVERLGLGDVVTFLGTISQKDVRQEMLLAKALVLPSFAEGLPVVLMESMALRRAVISTYIAGIPELVRPDAGWLIPAGDCYALSQAMREALFAHDRELSERGEAGRRWVLERHDIRASAALLECLIETQGIVDEISETSAEIGLYRVKKAISGA